MIAHRDPYAHLRAAIESNPEGVAQLIDLIKEMDELLTAMTDGETDDDGGRHRRDH